MQSRVIIVMTFVQFTCRADGRVCQRQRVHSVDSTHREEESGVPCVIWIILQLSIHLHTLRQTDIQTQSQKIIRKKRQFYEFAYPLCVFAINCTLSHTRTHISHDVGLLARLWWFCCCHHSAHAAKALHFHTAFSLRMAVLFSVHSWWLISHTVIWRNMNTRAQKQMCPCVCVCVRVCTSGSIFNANVKEITIHTMRNEKQQKEMVQAEV